MCGRFTEVVRLSVLSKRFKFLESGVPWNARYNLAPGQDALAVVNLDERKAHLMRWGLIPSWAKDPAIGYRMINARAETLLEKPSFRKPFTDRRCLVLADGFYEWKSEEGKKTKTPLRVVLKTREPFAFAGLWDIWKDPGGKEVMSFTIITTRATEALKTVHERMPVILEEKDEETWIDPNVWNPVNLQPLLKPYPSEKIDFYPVSTVVNSAQNDTEACIQPVSLV